MYGYYSIVFCNQVMRAWVELFIFASVSKEFHFHYFTNLTWPTFKVIYTKYFKHCPYTVAHTIECVCSKINHGLNYGLFISLLKLIYSALYIELYIYNSLFRFHIWILKQFWHCPKRPALPRQIKVCLSFIWTVCSTLHVYLWVNSER